jgi:hypothetical protein
MKERENTVTHAANKLGEIMAKTYNQIPQII